MREHDRAWAAAVIAVGDATALMRERRGRVPERRGDAVVDRLGERGEAARDRIEGFIVVDAEVRALRGDQLQGTRGALFAREPALVAQTGEPPL